MRYLLDASAVIGLLNDTTSKLARRARREKPSDVAMSAIVAHELRAPLGSVLNAVELMRHAERSGPQFTSLLDMVTRQTLHMSRLVNDLLDVTRISRDGFKLRVARVFDMFPHTHHVESLALFTRD